MKIVFVKTMKLTIYSLIFILFNVNSCLSQAGKDSRIEINSIIDSVKCNNEKYYYEFPDILSKNEINFFNNSMSTDYLNYLDLDIEKKNIRPSDIINMAILMRKKECNDNNNYSGFIGSNYKVTFNNFKIVSINMNYESMAGSINIDSYYYNFDIEKNKILQFNDIIKENKIYELLKKINSILLDRLNKVYKENKDELNNSDVYESLIHSKSLFKKENLDTFSISEKGIEYIFNYGFPNGSIAIENNIFISYNDLKMILKDDFKKKIGVY